MGIFRRFGDWLTEKSERFIRGESDGTGGYYASPEAEQAYGGMGMGQEPVQDGMEGEEAPRRQPLDPFGHGEGEYGGRVPYRSRYDLEREREAQQAAAQPQMPPQQQVPVQPVFGQQQGYAQPQGYARQQGYSQQQMGYDRAPQHSQQQVYGQQMSNVVPFPGMQRAADGSVYAHVEYIVLLRSRNECKDVIAYIKTNASVFLNMEFIASDSERQRCVDMLSGAAYTLGCALNKISPRGIYLISSPSVRVVLDPAMQKFTAAPEAQGYARQHYEGDGYRYGYQQTAEPEAQQPVMGFSSGSPTTRFQAQGTQRMPASFGSMMAGGATGAYAAVGGATGRYAAMQQ
ncbi:MAG TPA: cell division protein SepF [Candidatus Limiplasma pullistercoris]|nr:cell division protein SepF [Candidatus Limiplasma pullistercoris]